MDWMDVVIGPVLAIGMSVALVAAVWCWGVQGMVDRMQALFDRLAHGPAPKPVPVSRVDYAELARLEAEHDAWRAEADGR